MIADRFGVIQLTGIKSQVAVAVEEKGLAVDAVNRHLMCAGKRDRFKIIIFQQQNIATGRIGEKVRHGFTADRIKRRRAIRCEGERVVVEIEPALEQFREIIRLRYVQQIVRGLTQATGRIRETDRS